jgi:hypothetical protein
MKLTDAHVKAIVKTQTKIWLLAIMFASVFALFSKLIWTAKLPIPIFLPILMIGFALASINGVSTRWRRSSTATPSIG